MSTWEIVEQQEGRGKAATLSHDVVRDRRTVSTGLTRDNAERMVRKSRSVNEQVTLIEADGYRTEITKQFEPRGWRKPKRRP